MDFPLTKKYNNALKKISVNDPVHADTFNPLLEQLINNDEELSSKIGSAVKKVNGSTPDADGNITITVPEIDTKTLTTKTEFKDKTDALTSQLAETAKQAELKVERSRIDNLILTGGQDSSPEVADARVDKKGVLHNLVGQRLISDYENVQQDVALKMGIPSLQNKIKNGNFAIDTDGNGFANNWVGRAGATLPRIQGNAQYWTPTTVGYSGTLYTESYLKNTLGKKYYVSFESKNVGTYAWSGTVTQSYPVLTDGQFSQVFSSTQATDALSFLAFYGRLANVESYLKNVVFIDLTEVFGAGKEPNKEEMDKTIAGFPNRYFESPEILFNAKVLEERVKTIETKQKTVYLYDPRRDTKLKVSNLQPIASCDNVAEWTIDGGTLTIATEIDRSDYPENYPQEYTRYLPRWGNAMLKHDFSTPSVIHRSVNTSIEFMKDELALSVFIDDLSPRADIASIEIRFHSSYPNKDTNYYSRVLPAYRRKTATWEYLIESTPYYWTSAGSPQWSSINGVSIHVVPQTGKTARIYYGGVYKYRKQNKRGAIMIDFDDSLKSFYTQAFDYMTVKNGYRGNVGVVPHFVNVGRSISPTPNIAMTIDEHLNMQEGGWDMMNHTFNHASLAGTENSIISEIEMADKWMKERGLNPIGIIAPGNGVNRFTRHIAARYYKISRGRGPAPTSMPIPDIMDIGSWEMNDTEPIATWRTKLKYVQDNNLLWSFHFHEIGNTGYGFTTVPKFREYIDAIKDYDIDVLTYSDILNDKWI